MIRLDETKTIRIIVDASRAVDGPAAATRALANLEKQSAAMGSTLERMEAGIMRVSGFLRAQLAFVAFEAGQRIGEMARQAFDAAAGMGELSEKVGLTSRQLQGLQFVGVQNGATLDDVTTAATKFSVKMGEAATGSKAVIDELKALGVQNLDLQGKLRPNADLLSEVAQKITAIEDPARRSAAQVAFFGKSGTTMSAALRELSEGLDDAADKAQKFGAMISDSTAKKLDDIGDALDRQKLKSRATFANLIADVVDYATKIDDWLRTGATGINGWLTRQTEGVSGWQEKLRYGMDEAAVAVARFSAQFIEAFRAFPSLIGGFMATAMNSMLAGLEEGLNKANAALSKARSWFKSDATGSPISVGRVSGGDNGDYSARITNAGDVAEWTLREQQYAANQQRQYETEQREIEARRQAASGNYAGSRFSSTSGRPPPSVGGGYSRPSGGGGGGAEQSYAKLIEQLTAAAAAQDKMTAAAIAGDVAFQQQTIHAQAVEKAIGIFGKTLDETDPRLRKLEELIGRTTFGKLAEGFAKATNELQSQNEILEAQNRLMNEAPEIVAREIAQLKIKQEVEKAGGAITDEEINRRKAAIEQNETLKLQGEQLKASAALWSEPVIQAFRNIQTAGADAWENILTTGQRSFQSLGDVFKTTLRRMAAEFLALATIRPVMTLAIEAIGPGGLGLIGGQTMAQLGVPGGGGVTGAGAGGGGGLGSLLGGGGFGSIFSSGGAAGGGWLARQFSGISNWLSSPVSSLFGASATPAGGFADVGGLLASGQTGASAAATGGLSIGGALGGIGSIGMGAYGLLSGRGGTANTIGSIGQIAGGVMMMVPGLQPFGAALSILSGILPGLFGEGPKIPPQPPLAYSGGAFNGSGLGFSYEGGSVGAGSSLTSGATTIGTNLLKAFRAAGLTTVAGRLIGGGLGVGMDHTLNGQQWEDRPYTETELRLPGGLREALTGNDSSRTPEQASEFLLAQVFRANVLRGGVSGAGIGLRTGLDKINPTTSADLDRVVSLGTAYDMLGKAANPAKAAIDQVSASFDDLKSYATEAGLALEPINAEMKKQSERSAQDFIDSMLDPLAVAQRALADERESALESARYIRDNFENVHVDMDRIATYYTNKEAALRDQFYQGAVENLQSLIDRLTYGDLANASPTLQLSGTKAAYDTALARARSGDANAITDLSGYAESYLGVARQSFASSPEYQALVEQIRAALQEVQISITGGTATASTTAPSGQQTAVGQNMAQLQAMVRDLADDKADLLRELRQTNELVQRLVSGRAA